MAITEILPQEKEIEGAAALYRQAALREERARTQTSLWADELRVSNELHVAAKNAYHSVVERTAPLKPFDDMANEPA